MESTLPHSSPDGAAHQLVVGLQNLPSTSPNTDIPEIHLASFSPTVEYNLHSAAVVPPNPATDSLVKEDIEQDFDWDSIL